MYLWAFPGLPSSLAEQAEERLPSWYQRTGEDVFALVKAFVSDNDLCQPPLLVFPGAKVDDLRTALGRLAQPTAPCTSPVKLVHLVETANDGI